MQAYETIREYSKSVCAQIRWKKAHAAISEEIENHLLDQRDAYIAAGADEITATNNAVTQMGDPVIIGTQLDRTHRPKPQWCMILLTAAIVFIGLSIRIFLINDGDRPWLLPRQLVSAVVGLGFMLAAYFSDFTLIGKYPKITFFSIMALSVLALMISPTSNGQIFYAGFMPLLFPSGFAAIVYTARNKGYWGIVLCGLIFLVLSLIALLVPTLSGLLLFGISGLAVLSIAVSKNWFKVKKRYGYLLIFVPVISAALFALANTSGRVWMRLQIALNPSIDAVGAGFAGTVTRALLHGSKLFGRGVIPSKYAALTFPSPNIDTDYLLTYLIFHVGWIAFIVIMGVLLFFIVQGFMLCFKQKSGLGLFLSISIMLTFTMQVLGYTISNLGFQLISPISLPLISYGNVATLINLFLIGLMLSVFRTGDVVMDKHVKVIGKERRITWDEGKLIISFVRK